MSLQYISDDSGKTTGVFIPIAKWNELKSRYTGIEEEQIDVLPGQMDEVRKRLEDYHKMPEQALDFDAALTEIEKDL